MPLRASFELDGRVSVRVADFHLGDCWLAGSALLPEDASPLGVVLVVGGPQYRVGAHRLFFNIARRVAAAGHPALIFDHRGIGDSEGSPRSYHEIEDDIRAAIDNLSAIEPKVRHVVLWGLCDGATACALYARSDPRVAGMILANPWLEPTRSHAQSKLTNYYGRRLASFTFWRDLVRGRLKTIAALKGMALEGLRAAGLCNVVPSNALSPTSEEIAAAIGDFDGSVHFILSGRDVTARAFALELEQNPAWRRLAELENLTRADVADADHTFSRSDWEAQLLEQTLRVVASIERASVITAEEKSPAPVDVRETS